MKFSLQGIANCTSIKEIGKKKVKEKLN